jgi:tRNA(fMet)-specific endonuclease VapC
LSYLLDTNAWISYLRQSIPQLTQKFQNTNPADIALSSVVLAELFYGAHHGSASNRASNLALIGRLQQRFASLPFEDRAAAVYGQIRALLAGQGAPIGPNGLMIASIALANGLTLVTHNTSEFSRIPILKLEDWQ